MICSMQSDQMWNTTVTEKTLYNLFCLKVLNVAFSCCSFENYINDDVLCLTSARASFIWYCQPVGWFYLYEKTRSKTSASQVSWSVVPQTLCSHHRSRQCFLSRRSSHTLEAATRLCNQQTDELKCLRARQKKRGTCHCASARFLTATHRCSAVTMDTVPPLSPLLVDREGWGWREEVVLAILPLRHLHTSAA